MNKELEIIKELIMNVKPKFLNVMKRFLFTMMTLVVLVLVANTAFAVDGDSESPYFGSTHSYNLINMSVQTNGTVTIAVDAGLGSISGTPTNGTTNLVASGSDWVFNTTDDEIVFSVAYLNAAATGNITVTLTEGGVDGCSNHIILPINLISPVFTLNMGDNATAVCQTLGTASKTTDAAAAADGVTAVTYTITPGATGATGYTYNYILTISGGTTILTSGDGNAATVVNGTMSQSGNALTVTNADGDTGASVITLYVKTVEGTPTTLIGTLTETANTTPSFGLSGGGTVYGTIAGGTREVPFKDMPTIGTWN